MQNKGEDLLLMPLRICDKDIIFYIMARKLLPFLEDCQFGKVCC